MTISHVHCSVRDLQGAVAWFTEKCRVPPGFQDARIAAFKFGSFTLILDAASSDGVMTVGFDSRDCDADFAAMMARGAAAIEPPADRPYGARVAYLKGPGAIKIEIEQFRASAD